MRSGLAIVIVCGVELIDMFYIRWVELNVPAGKEVKQYSQPASPSGFGYGRADPGILRDGPARLWESGFPKKKPSWVTCGLLFI